MARNPWLTEALSRSSRADEPHAEAALILGEYARHEAQEGSCPKCDGALYWEVTVGARKCSQCGALDI